MRELFLESREMFRQYLGDHPRYRRYPPELGFHVRFPGGRAYGLNHVVALAKAEIAEADSVSLYVHYPWCAYICKFCHYAVLPRLRAATGTDEFVEAIKANLGLLGSQLSSLEGKRVSSLYFGGGTPSLLPLSSVEALVSSLGRQFAIDPDCEITIEANPETINRDWIRGIASLGFNRLSMGVQVLDDDALAALNRRHSSADVMNAISEVDAFFAGTYNIDLIYGLPSVASIKFLEDVSTLISCGVPSFTLYRLRLGRPDERESALLPRFRREPEQFADQATTLAQSFVARQLSRGAGLSEHPIGWYTRPEKPRPRCYQDRWRDQRPLIGVGPSAYSYGKGWQWRNAWSPQDWQSALGRQQLPIEEAVGLSSDERRRRREGFHLRFAGSVPGGALATKTGTELVMDGLATNMADGELRLTDIGRALIDETLEEFFFLGY